MKIQTQVCVLGAGAGGTGCVFRLIKNGIKTVAVDRNPDFGGTAVFSGVDGWEPGTSLDGMHQLLKDVLMEKGAGHMVGEIPNMNLWDPNVGRDWTKHSYTEFPICYLAPSTKTYEQTLTTWRNGAARFQFEPEVMVEAVHRVMEPYKENLTTLFEHSYTSCKTENGRLRSITVSGKDGDVEIFADYFVDATNEIVLARAAGCDHTFGAEGRDELGEPSAVADPRQVNGVSYVFRIARAEDPNHIDPVPEEIKKIDLGNWTETVMKQTIGFSAQYPNGDLNVNMLPTINGREYFELGDRADEIGRARVYVYWHYLQTEKKMAGWYLKKIYEAGIRESYRLRGKYILREQDLRLGMLRQPKVGRTVAIADHALDIHSEDVENGGVASPHLDSPYEIPLECTMTKEYENLYVASIGASFSHIAASSVRLTRTMLSMGEGVGEYIAECLTNA